MIVTERRFCCTSILRHGDGSFVLPEESHSNPDKLSDKEQRVLELLIEDPGFTSLQIAEKLNVSRVSVTKYLKALKEKGIISRIGSDRKGYWRINQ